MQVGTAIGTPAIGHGEWEFMGFGREIYGIEWDLVGLPSGYLK